MAPFSLGWLLALLALLGACRHGTGPVVSGPSISPGMLVTIHYTVTLRDKTVVVTTADGAPLSYVHGHRTLLPALERGIEGMRPGDRSTLVIAAEEAFGPYNDAKVDALPRGRFPPDVAVGAEYEDQIGRTLRVVEVGGDTVVVDWNHPLAGQDLIVDVLILDVQKPESR